MCKLIVRYCIFFRKLENLSKCAVWNIVLDLEVEETEERLFCVKKVLSGGKVESLEGSKVAAINCGSPELKLTIILLFFLSINVDYFTENSGQKFSRIKLMI